MAVVGIEIMREGEGGGCEGERAAARVGGPGNAGRGASPTAGKREGI